MFPINRQRCYGNGYSNDDDDDNDHYSISNIFHHHHHQKQKQQSLKMNNDQQQQQQQSSSDEYSVYHQTNDNKNQQQKQCYNHHHNNNQIKHQHKNSKNWFNNYCLALISIMNTLLLPIFLLQLINCSNLITAVQAAQYNNNNAFQVISENPELSMVSFLLFFFFF